MLGDGPPVVLTHGTPTWSYLWREIGNHLARDHTVYLWDLLGYGHSRPRAHTLPSVALHAECLAELLGHWGLTGDPAPALIGRDIGGGTVLRALLRHGVHARALVLMDAAVLPPWVTPLAAHMQQHIDAYRSMPNATFTHLITAHLNTATETPLAPAIADAYLQHYLGPPGQQCWLDHVAGFHDEDTRDIAHRLHQIDIPTTVIWGERDHWLPPDTGRRLHHAIPGSTFVAIPGAGHLVTEDAAGPTLHAIRHALNLRS
ncbi:haloalkane dehalogenase [Amycolatopsis antarctica]|uniref:Haloalkane dehalogenase n=1 Tax=Amycolatopsis antarctica TaxID=1854586 RepID=A0A263D9T0_9PSEU|nr:haloalkane dehalogenase [Amycolatopsis antarctica]